MVTKISTPAMVLFHCNSLESFLISPTKQNIDFV